MTLPLNIFIDVDIYIYFIAVDLLRVCSISNAPNVNLHTINMNMHGENSAYARSRTISYDTSMYTTNTMYDCITNDVLENIFTYK